MIRYERSTDDLSRATAIFADGSRVPVTLDRQRRFPGVDSCAPDTRGAYALAAEALTHRAINVADLGCGAGEGTAILARARLSVVGFDHAAEAVAFARRFSPSVMFREGSIGAGESLPHDAVVLIDALGFGDDDAALLRGLAHRVAEGTTLVGAVPVASVGQVLSAGVRRAFTRETVDALLVRTGWAPPVSLGRVDGLEVFESHRVPFTAAHAALELCETLDTSSAAATETVLLRLAGAARTTAEPALARELLIAMALLQLDRGDIAAADEAASSANAIAPSAARPFVLLGRTARARGDVDDAEALFDHALSYDDCCVTAWSEWAACLEARGDIAAAVEALGCAASLEPANATIAATEARLLSSSGDASGAVRVLDRVLTHGGVVPAALRTTMAFVGAASMQRPGSRPITGVFRVPELRGAVNDRMAS